MIYDSMPLPHKCYVYRQYRGSNEANNTTLIDSPQIHIELIPVEENRQYVW